MWSIPDSALIFKLIFLRDGILASSLALFSKTTVCHDNLFMHNSLTIYMLLSNHILKRITSQNPLWFDSKTAKFAEFWPSWPDLTQSRQDLPCRNRCRAITASTIKPLEHLRCRTLCFSNHRVVAPCLLLKPRSTSAAALSAMLTQAMSRLYTKKFTCFLCSAYIYPYEPVFFPNHDSYKKMIIAWNDHKHLKTNNKLISNILDSWV